jgi:ABC-type bacteriocin/lantibiotic exporter with double-glycine peptidase domain
MSNLASRAASQRAEAAIAVVESGLERVIAAVSGTARRRRPHPEDEREAFAFALAEVLRGFGCAVDGMSIASLVREGDFPWLARRICEPYGVFVRDIEIGSLARTFAGPVIAFRGSEAVVLRPGVWRRWREIGGEGKRGEPFQPGGFTFYRDLPAAPTTVRALLRAAFGRESRVDLGYALAWGLAGAALTSASVFLLSWLVEWVLPEGDRGGVALLSAGWVVVAVAASNLRLARALLALRIGARMGVATEAALVKRTLDLPLSAFKGEGAGDTCERIRDASQLARASVELATDLALAAASLVVYGGILAATSLGAALAVAAVLGARAATSAPLLVGTRRHAADLAKARGGMSVRLFEIITGIARIKVAGAEARAFYQWALDFAKVRRAGYRGSVVLGGLRAAENLFDVVGIIVLYAALCRGGGADLGVFFIASAALGGLQGACSSFMGGVANVLPLLPRADRIRPLLEAPTEARTGLVAPALKGEVSLRGVTFHYGEKEARVLDDVTLDVRPGEFVAIVGPSGCGKSTLLRLLLGFYPPTSGSVLFDGRDLASMDLRSVRSQIGAVLQGSELLPSSLLFNIIGTSKLTVEEAWVAARRACVADDIERMPMKMFTTLGDRAVTLSGGQKQRILIARALVRQPKLVVLDEATSALDNHTQAGVIEALRGLSCAKICVAHRLSTVAHADRIVVMDRGAIVQQGSFDQLVRQSGLFRQLAETQLVARPSLLLDA